ncbi:hypothetical protein POLEWNIK_00320 [Brevundimonas phage vB_BpoS-Polewnik]|nr:hypothetical protein POLEWNIK_00320 [Brevundimonas phage vB_BpoS-Polewnik]
MAKTEAQKEAARQRRLARQGKVDPGYTRDDSSPQLRGVSDAAKNFDPTDYSAAGGWKKCQRQVLALIEELEVMIEGPMPEEVTHTMVGDLASIRVHLERSILHARSAKHCLNCPTHQLPKIRNHTRG